MPLVTHYLRMKLPSKTLLVTTLVLVLYIATLSSNYTGGSLQFVGEIERGNWATLLKPHKMLMHPIGWAFLQIWRIAGWRGLALYPMQVFNALGGALSVGLMYAMCVQLTKDTRLALVIAAGFAVSCSTWLFSTEAEFVMPPMVACLLVIYWLLGTDTASSLRHWFGALLG